MQELPTYVSTALRRTMNGDPMPQDHRIIAGYIETLHKLLASKYAEEPGAIRICGKPLNEVFDIIIEHDNPSPANPLEHTPSVSPVAKAMLNDEPKTGGSVFEDLPMKPHDGPLRVLDGRGGSAAAGDLSDRLLKFLYAEGEGMVGATLVGVIELCKQQLIDDLSNS